MDSLPDDIVRHIQTYCNDYEDLLNLKKTGKYFDQSITSMALRKLMLYGVFSNYNPTIACVNIDCYYDTWDIYEDVYNIGYRRYIHSHQSALNITNATINKKQYQICSPYCCECFKKYVLIGDKNNVTNYLIEEEVNIDYPHV